MSVPTVQRETLTHQQASSFSHSDEDVDRTINVVDQALQVYVRALEDGVEKHLLGRPVKPVNRRYNWEGRLTGT